MARGLALWSRTWAFVALALLLTRCGGGGGGGPGATTPGTPSVDSVSPTSITQGAVGETITLAGTNFDALGTVDFGPGITVTSTSFVSAFSFQATVDVDLHAAMGPHDVVFQRSTGQSGGLAGALQVDAPAPAVTSVAPDTLLQGSVGTVLTITGTNFRDGCTVDLGAGLSVMDTDVLSDSTIEVTVDSGANTPLGAHDVSYEHPAVGGGATTDLAGALQVDPVTPTITSISPTTITQGDTGTVITVTGTDLRDGGTVTFGTGITVTQTTWNNPTEMVVTVNAHLTTTPLGPHDVVYTHPPVAGSVSATLTNGLQVNAPTPTVASINVTTVVQGASGIQITLTGTNFRAGGTASFGTGITVTGSTFLSTTSFRATVDVDLENAPLGAHDVVFTQPAVGGGASGTLTNGLQVNAPTPTVTAINGTSVVQGSSGVTITLTGTNFRPGGTVSFGAGIAVTGTNLVSSTSFEATVNVHLTNATLGSHDVVYSQAAGAGGASGTLTSGLQVNAPTPAIQSVSPGTTKSTSFLLTVNGSNFRSGGVLSVPGVTVGATTIVSESQATATVTVAPTATAGARDVTYTHPSAGGSGAVTSTGALTILYPDPTITSILPTSVSRGSSGITVVLAGTGFRPDGGVTLSGTDPSTGGYSWMSDTSCSIVVTTTASATLGTRDVVYTHAAAGGGASATLTNGLTVSPAGPYITSIVPSTWKPGDARAIAAINGGNYASGMTVSLSGSGFTIHSTTFVSSSLLRVEYSVASTATLGARNLTITPSSGSPVTFNGAVTIGPAAPTVTSLSHVSLATNSSTNVTIRGTNFRSGDQPSASGTGISFSSVTVSNATTMTASMTVASGATTGARNLIVTHSSGDGGASGTLASAFSVVSGSPTVSSVAPSTIARTGSGGPTRSVPVTVTGTNFVSGAVLTVAKSGGSGLSVVSGSSLVVSTTTLSATLAVTGTATTGTWNFTVTNPNSAAGTGTDVLTVNDEDTLTINVVLPSSGSSGGGERVTIQGGGFLAGAVVDFGSVRAAATLVIDKNTIVTTVPIPASVSKTAATFVGVKVTNPSGSPTNTTLANGYAYARDEGQPYVLETFPADGATGVARNIRTYVFVLSEPMLPSSVSSVSGFDWFKNSTQDISSPRVVSVGAAPGRRLVSVRRNATPTNLTASVDYFVNIPTTATDVAGNPLDPAPYWGYPYYQGFFTTAASTTDTTAPTATISPANGSTGVGVATPIVVTFNEPVDPASISLTNITFKQGSTTISASISLGLDCRTVTILPEATLTASTTYTTNVTANVTDLCGNVFSNSSYSFTTGSTDGTAPTVTSIVIEKIPATLDGSGTYVNQSGTNTSFDLYLPKFGWLVEVFYTDTGSGVDEATFSAKANVAVGGASANTELASNFTKTSSGASWRIPSSGFTAGDGATFSFSVKDKAGNTATTATVTFNVADITSTATGDPNSEGASGGDLDPFTARQTWILRPDLDSYTATLTNPGGTQRGATTTNTGNGITDLDESLRYTGLNTGSMTTSAAACVNGNSVGTNAIVRNLFLQRLRALFRVHYGIGEDGTYGPDSANIEFLLPGEQGSLSSLPTYGSGNSWSTSNAYSEMSIGGTWGAESNALTAGGVLGAAWLDGRNTRQEDDLNNDGTTGLFLLSMLKFNVNSAPGTMYRTRISNKFLGVYGGTPAGEGSLDHIVLADTFVRANGTAAQQARYDDLMDAIELIAAYTASVGAHEVGHSTGLVMNKVTNGTDGDGAPKTGLFGNAHYNNAFTEATSAYPNTGFHMDYIGNDTMGAAVAFESGAATGTNIQTFSPLDRAYLLKRLIYDEGK